MATKSLWEQSNRIFVRKFLFFKNPNHVWNFCNKHLTGTIPEDSWLKNWKVVFQTVRFFIWTLDRAEMCWVLLSFVEFCWVFKICLRTKATRFLRQLKMRHIAPHFATLRHIKMTWVTKDFRISIFAIFIKEFFFSVVNIDIFEFLFSRQRCAQFNPKKP